ncbi:MAG TPA: hypothetical protein VGK17_15410 [Propionicimonas sp.]|jgi:hypothetical protein
MTTTRDAMGGAASPAVPVARKDAGREAAGRREPAPAASSARARRELLRERARAVNRWRFAQCQHQDAAAREADALRRVQELDAALGEPPR